MILEKKSIYQNQAEEYNVNTALQLLLPLDISSSHLQ
jgi:hypothetical protein